MGGHSIMAPSKPNSTADAATIRHRLNNLDATLSLQLHTFSQPLPRFLLLALELSGDGRFFFPVVISLLIFPLSSSSSSATPLLRILADLLLGGLLDLLVVGLTKVLVRRPRPVYNKGMILTVSADHWSFPSGHSSRVCFIASFLYLLSSSIPEAFRHYGKTADYFVLIVSLWAATTSVSRVLLGRHFVFDVFAGACLGVAEALFVFYFSKHVILS